MSRTIQTPTPGKVYHGDCIDVMMVWKDNVFDACIADPPYGILKKGLPGGKYTTHVTTSDLDQFKTLDEYLHFNRQWINQMVRVVKPNGNLFVWANNSNRRYVEEVLSDNHGLKMINAIVWHKPNAQPNITKRMLQHSHEYILWYVNGKSHWDFDYEVSKTIGRGKQLHDVWDYPYLHHTKRTHKNEKPVELLERLIMFGTKPDDLVLDPFAGSGTTGHACVVCDRRYVMIENNIDHVTTIADRMKTLAGLDPKDCE